MRSLVSALAVCLLTPCLFAQRHSGVFRPEGGAGISWTINEHGALVWNGQPYLPVGTRIEGSPAAIKAAKAAGVQDVLIDLPVGGAGWAECDQALKETGLRYLMRIDSLAPMARGFAVQPESYRVDGISKSGPVRVSLPGATSAFVVLASKRDRSVTASGRYPVENGTLNYDVKGPAGVDLDCVLLIYPEMTSLEQPDFWENLDGQRDALLGNLKKFPPTAGLRAIVNPLGRTETLPGKSPRFVPTSPYFRFELAQLLEQRYRTVETALRSWSVSSSALTSYSMDSVDDKNPKPLATFEDLARLVPLWSGSRGVPDLFDPQTNRIYTCDDHRSTFWSDVAEAINAAETKRYQRLVDAIHSVVDVPVIQEWAGWSAPYETKQPSVDGIGMKAYGTTPSELVETGCRATSSILRWPTPGWLVATDADLGNAKDAASQLGGVLDDLTSLGARGIFVRADDPAVLKAVVAENQRRASNADLASTSPAPVFFPENATNPAVAQRLPAGHWWLPAPADGNRIDFGSLFSGYQMRLDGQNSYAIWTAAPGRFKLLMAKPEGATFTTVDGTDPNPKIVKGGVEVNLTELPLLVTKTEELPVPAPAVDETVTRFAAAVKLNDTYHGDLTQESLLFQQNYAGLARNPGGNFVLLRQIYRHTVEKMGTFTWIEAEAPTTTNFSDVISAPGASGDSALALHTSIPSPTGFFADYRIPVRSTEPQEVWVAARIPAEERAGLQVLVADQPLLITEPPIGSYGTGFAWYRLGTTRLSGNVTSLKVRFNFAESADVAIDAIVLSPGQFHPSGVRMPDLALPIGPAGKPEAKPGAKPGARKGSAGP